MKSNHDQSFVNFLKQYEPVPPPAASHAEASLMALIAEKSPSSQSRSSGRAKVVWLIPTAIAAGMTLVWGRYQSYLQTPQIADYDWQPPTLTMLQPTLQPSMNQTPTEDFATYLETAWSDPFRGTESSETYLGYEELMSVP
ncbi:hypothetical protein [[Limnothrix rosea] IAM M-220]|uniref:hypothetical protein n=1 Tax=[Limnothrix rosea] IAM M-220 TaxID=454133 RepID=UPI000960AEC9|nr:hypothetical protein [[Limnothrix rosea] IAM M-220]OKH14164.1 hypothetical protein NIES208_14390 [[Limnothrix rosea] IAM M-220]